MHGPSGVLRVRAENLVSGTSDSGEYEAILFSQAAAS